MKGIPTRAEKGPQQGEKELLFRYIVLAVLVTALTGILLLRFYQHQRVRKLHDAVEHLSRNARQKDWIGHAIQSLYTADNQFRFYTLTFSNSYFAQYTASLQQAASALDSLQAADERDPSLLGMLADKKQRSALFAGLKRSTDSLLSMNTAWDTTRDRNSLPPIAGVNFRAKVQTDTLGTQVSVSGQGKRKKLIGRLADALSNKQTTAGDTGVQQQYVRTAVTLDSSGLGRQYNRRQMRRIHEYYEARFRQIRDGQTQLQGHEYEMMVANDRILKTLLSDLQALRQEQQEARIRQQQALTTGISALLVSWGEDSVASMIVILVMLALILVLIYFSYKTSVRLNRARLEALRQSHLKSDFVSNISHELRTPLSSVIGFAEQLEKTELQEDQREMVSAIHTSSNMLHAVVNNVLDFSKLEAGRLDLSASIFSPRNVLDEVIRGLQPQADQQYTTLQQRFTFSGGDLVHGDAFRLKQILINLVNNAIKFTVHGTVTIDAALYTVGLQRRLEVSVTDTGAGISPSQLEHIFDRYAQGSGTVGNPDPGNSSGLGLAIVKKLVDLHGGQIAVESAPGKGSTFRFFLPYRPAVKPVPAPAAAAKNEPPPVSHVLIVDDNALNRRLLERIFQNIGATYASAANGREALTLLQSQDFDIVLTDIGMPEMDGLTLLKHIRTLPDRKKAQLPVIAITGNVVREELEMYLTSGFNSYVPKPFRESDILEKIRLVRSAGMATPE
ncbi:ATP-binding protein [Chitinophaga lutea]